jgi:hypothetical protein
MRLIHVLGLLLIFLLVFGVSATLVNQVAAENQTDSLGQPQVSNNGQWWQINSTTITVLFPAQGQKPMFLWYYNDNSSEVYCVKYRGLIEYLSLNGYYTPDCESNPQTMESLMLSEYGGMGGMGMSGMQGLIDNAYPGWVSNFHPSYLRF